MSSERGQNFGQILHLLELEKRSVPYVAPVAQVMLENTRPGLLKAGEERRLRLLAGRKSQ